MKYMKVYTYCSFEASSKGYQYTVVDKKKNDNRPEKGSIPDDDEGKEIKEWMEKLGWKLVLKRKEKFQEEAYLFLASLESVIEDINKRRRDDKVGKDLAKKYDPEKNSVLELEKVEVYVNIALCGSLYDLYSIAIGCMLELHENEGKEIYKELRNCIKSTESMDSYMVDGGALFGVLKALRVRGEGCIPKERKHKKLAILKKIENKISIHPYIRRKGKDTEREINTIINGLPRPDEFSLDNMICIVEDGNLEDYGIFNVAMDYNFVKKRY